MTLSKWQIIKKKARTIWRVVRADNVLFSSILAPREQLKVLIGSELRDQISVNDATSDFRVSDITERVFARLTKHPTKTFEEKFHQTLDGIASMGLWNFYNVCGMASVWEYEFRLLALRYGVNVKIPADKKSKKAKRRATIVLRFLEEVIPDLSARTGNRLNINQVRLLELRNSLVHGNFQELRVKATGGKHRFPDEYRGNVFVATISELPSQPRNLSEVKKDDEVEQEDLFGWFLEGTTSKMLHDLHDEFLASVEQIRDLIAFKSMSFDGREALFSKLVDHGKSLTDDDVAIYQRYFEESGAHRGLNARKMLDRVQRCFKDLKA